MEIMQNTNLTNQDTNFLQAYLNHLTEEQRKAFVATYMYILNVGMGDAQFESQNFESLLEAEELSMYNLDEGLIGNVMNFLKGKSAITKYYKGLDGAAKNYVSSAKKIDKMDKDKRAQFRKSELDKYEKSVKSLDDIKSKIDELKKDSKILQKMDSYANNKYKLKMFLTGRKANVSLSKMKGYEEDIEKIKADQTTLEDDIKKANAEAEELKKKKEEEEKANAEKDKNSKGEPETTDTPEKTEKKKTPKETKAEKIETDTETVKAETEKTKADTAKIEAEAAKEKAEEDAKNAGKEKIKKKIVQFNNTKLKLKKEIVNNPEKKESNEKGIKSLDDKIENLEKQLEENKTLSLSFFYDLESLNEEIKCLENSIGERL
mgnify:CR=1 FL=1|tara:strand:+ start:1458 stop:2585 length:1128 start_codon:yes stop_codon:yes gene_type:complete